MSRKYYKAIAKVIDETEWPSVKVSDAKENLVYSLVELFADDNPNFSQEKFVDACCKKTREDNIRKEDEAEKLKRLLKAVGIK